MNSYRGTHQNLVGWERCRCGEDVLQGGRGRPSCLGRTDQITCGLGRQKGGKPGAIRHVPNPNTQGWTTWVQALTINHRSGRENWGRSRNRTQKFPWCLEKSGLVTAAGECCPSGYQLHVPILQAHDGIFLSRAWGGRRGGGFGGRGQVQTCHNRSVVP